MYKKRHRWWTGLVILPLVVCSGMVWADKNDAQDQGKTYPPYHGPKKTVAVLPFENKARGITGNSQVGEGMTEILITELIRTNRFNLVERDVMSDVVSEQALGQTGLVTGETAVRTGQMAGADYMIKGAVTEFHYEAAGGGITLGFDRGEIGVKAKSAYVGVDVRLIDNATGQIFASYNASAKARSTGGKIGLSEDEFKVGTSVFASTPLGVATREAIDKIVVFILEENEGIPWSGSVIGFEGGEIYINRGRNSNLKEGDQLVVYKKGRTLIDPETGFNLGSRDRKLCTTVITYIEDKFSISEPGAVCRGKTIQRGDLIKLE
ncbi:CsgG/HfaB family protein [Pseudomonadota bacterium]